MKKLHLTFQPKKYVLLIQNSQNPDGGFGIVPHTTSFLESTYHALKSLKELNTIPLNITKCERFVHSCITKTGGFGRQITTVPSIQYSYYAFISLNISLKIINEMKRYYIKQVNY
ncbi:MAG: hypothetical protein QHH15_03320 [Candidatus Thermoplasmatota archaeon]|nr:hypothetical protein [Candidatus Thermoplasmatota archaeon]